MLGEYGSESPFISYQWRLFRLEHDQRSESSTILPAALGMSRENEEAQSQG
jgi:hypothetical protein